MTNIANLASRYAGRPLLLTPSAAADLAHRLRSLDPRAFERPGRLSAFLRRVGLAPGGGQGLRAWDDDGDWAAPPPLEERLAYAPRWAGEIEDQGYAWSLKSGVALIGCDTPLVERGEEFCGVVYHGYDTLLLALREALADERVGGVFLRLDCPGGVVGGGLNKLAAFIRDHRASAGGKPIWVFADMACSAAYWIAAQADRILAPSVGYVGSIGAVIVHESRAAMLSEAGVEITAIQFGELKTDGAWWAKLSETARASFQSDVDECGRAFLAAVTAGRPALTADALMATKAQAFMAEHADPERSGLALGFVDEITDEEAAFEALAALVADPTPGPGQHSPAADGSRTAATPKEAPMAVRPTNKAQIAARRAKLQEELDQLDEEEAATGGDPGEGEETDEDADAEDAAPASGEAAAIAASKEAKAHPALALAAIQSGQTLAQFKASASAAAAGGGARMSRLDAVMRGSARLGADGVRVEGGRSGHASAISARAERNREKAGA
jgi:ClpP class serine protease